MWAAAVVDLGLAPVVFWSLTPREFDVLFKRHLEREHRADNRAGLIAATIANYAGKMLPDGKTVSASDFTGGVRHSVTELERFRALASITPEQLVEELRSRDPLGELTLGYATLEGAAPQRGVWSKLGTREGLMQPLNVALVMAGKKPQ